MKGRKQEMPGEKPVRDFNNNHMTPNFLKMNKKKMLHLRKSLLLCQQIVFLRMDFIIPFKI